MRTSAVTERALRFGPVKVDATSPSEFPIYLTLKEVAELLKVKPRTVYAWVVIDEFRLSVKVACCGFDLMQ